MASPVPYEFERSIARAFERHKVPDASKIIVGLSGGADSVALMHGLLALRDKGAGYRIIAAHLNHGLRGSESDRDETFVRTLCARLGAELITEQANDLNGSTGNLEERARIRRHEFLNRVADDFNARYIALAHHLDDQAETVLLRLMRGCGIAGASGMAEAGSGRLLRPLLDLSRADVLGYLEALGESYITDSTNLGIANSRSRVRNELLPLLERDYAPGLRGRLSEFARELRSTDDFLTASAKAELRRRGATSQGGLELAGFAELHEVLAKAMLREYLRIRRGDLRRVNRAHIESMYILCTTGPVSGWCDLPGGWRMRREYHTAMIERTPRQSAMDFEIRMSPLKASRLEAGGFDFAVAAVEIDGAFLAAHPSGLRMGTMEALFDQDHVLDELTIRSFRSGDRIRPLGMNGSRKVHDLFIDRKLPRERRRSWPLLTAKGGEILWIPGMARSRSALVNQASRRALLVTAEARPAAADVALPRI
jgi:tRNA(Ile)-lysidine synthase